jgi:hypothetical protein
MFDLACFANQLPEIGDPIYLTLSIVGQIDNTRVQQLCTQLRVVRRIPEQEHGASQTLLQRGPEPQGRLLH